MATHLNETGGMATGGTRSGLPTLIVEDNPMLREELSSTLNELAGLSIVNTCATAKSAMCWLERHQGDWSLAIVDIFLVEGSGLEVVDACRDRAPHQHVVVISNYATSDMRRRCKELGAEAIFDKSTEIDALILYCTSLSAH